jgi:spermidine synthase
MIGQVEWVDEKWEELHVRYKVRKVIQEIKTDFQHLLLVDTFKYGRMLLLDGMVQTTEKDEFIYHEMMAHVPLMSHPDPKRILIIGGGDGGVLREVLKHDSVEKATIVEIDQMVIDFSKEYLPSISDGGFDDGRTELIIDDGFAFIRETSDQFDVVVVDSPDPIGPATILFSKEFYEGIRRVLNPGGVMVRQTGSIHMQSQEQRQVKNLLKEMFRHSAFYVYAVPTYVGGFFSTIFCSDFINPMTVDIGAIIEKYISDKFKTKYYNPGLHVGAFHVPRFMAENLG